MSAIEDLAAEHLGAARTVAVNRRHAQPPFLDRAESGRLLHAVEQFGGLSSGRLLEIGTNRGTALAEGSHRGFDVHVVDAVDHQRFPDHHFDVCVCTNALEAAGDPIDCLNGVHRMLKPDGVLVLIASAAGNRVGGSAEAMQNLLAQSGFIGIEASPLRLNAAPFAASGVHVTALARASVKRSRPLVSIIVPVYNERQTVAILLEGLVAKTLEGLDKEIIVVEDNSSDGTRDEVLRFAAVEGMRVILQDRPRGKGFAVREGLRHASGDIVLIQDADLEYSLDDYDSVLEPVRTYRRSVVLGSRHLPGAKMRVFTDQRLLGLSFNTGHLLLTGLFNLFFRQTLKDPWTMYKVFRRDCLHGLRFECDRFDFDVELLAKLIRKGYAPVEVPVTYKSRSFKEGKKIRVMTDPWTWLWACVKYRLVSPYAARPQDGNA